MSRSAKGISLLAGIIAFGLVGLLAWRLWVRVSTEPSPAQVPVWADIANVHGDDISLRGFELWAGLLDGTSPVHVSIQFDTPLAAKEVTRALPFVSRPAGSLVAYGYFNGQNSELHVLDLATGTDRLVARKPIVFHHAAIASDGTVFALELDPASRAETGTFAYRGNDPPRLVIGPRDLPFRAMSHSDVGLSPSGLLILEDCTFSGCTIRLYEPGGVSEVKSLEIGNASVVGFDDSAVAIAPFCNLACARQVLSVPGLETSTIGRSCGPAAYARVAGIPAIISGSSGDCSAPGDELIAQWANEGRRVVGHPGLSEFTLLDPSRSSVVGLPTGVVLLTESGTLGLDERAALLDLNTENVTEIRINRAAPG